MFADGYSALLVLCVLLAALLLDALIGDPPWLYARCPHPVAIMGRGIAWLEARLNRGSRRRARGIAAAAVIVLTGWVAGAFLHALFAAVPGGMLLEIAAAAVLLAQRDLFEHVRAVATALDDNGLDAARQAVSRIVGRDTSALDVHGICRAAIESAAENFADGVAAPAFWYLLLGLPGLVAYKAANTADSMLGHRSPRYLEFGWAAARLDDALNFLPARGSGILAAAAAAFLPGADPKGAIAAMRKDAPRHESPNAGWPEAAFAGALGLSLGGPRRYGDAGVDGAWLGGGRRDAERRDIRRGLELYAACGLLLAALIAVAAGLIAAG